MCGKKNTRVSELRYGSKTEFSKTVFDSDTWNSSAYVYTYSSVTIFNDRCNTGCFILSSVYGVINYKNRID